jgi:hypothetical protein
VPISYGVSGLGERRKDRYDLEYNIGIGTDDVDEPLRNV